MSLIGLPAFVDAPIRRVPPGRDGVSSIEAGDRRNNVSFVCGSLTLGLLVELRDIEIFLTLAEELHFGRTAERLRVSPARVSQAVSKQERRLGVALFDRTSRRVSLTPVGRRLREDLQQALDLLQAGLARAEAAGLGAGQRLRLGVFGHAGHALRPLVDAFRARYPGSDVQFGEVYGSDPFTALRTGDNTTCTCCGSPSPNRTSRSAPPC
jgi:hypothetical protein